ncbi:MAG TPA: hypothetical protein VFI53_07115 [Myxococcaceae bacterium]|nr:hypothetical protein [Myxococcaceae bacterium]
MLSSVRVLAPDGTEITIGQSAPFTTTVAGRYTVCALGPGWSPQSLPALVDFPYTLVVRVP